MVALVGVLLLGILKGVIVAAVMSLAMLLRDMARPHVAALGRIPGTRRYSDLERHPDNETVPGVLIVRVEAPLLYFNANHVRDAVRQHLGSALDPVRAVVFDLATSPTSGRDRGPDARVAAAGAGDGRHPAPLRQRPRVGARSAFVPAAARPASVR